MIYLKNNSIYQNNSKRKYFKLLTNLEPLENRGKNANRYLKLETKIAKNIAILLLKHGVSGRKTMKKRKLEKSINNILVWGGEKGFWCNRAGKHLKLKK